MSFLVPQPLSSNGSMTKKSLREAMSRTFGDGLVERLCDDFTEIPTQFLVSKHSELGDLLKLEAQNEFRLSRQLEQMFGLYANLLEYCIPIKKCLMNRFLEMLWL